MIQKIRKSVLVLLGLLFGSIILRDIFYRFFFIYPHTDRTGRYSAFMEAHDICRWLVPIASGKKGKTDIFFVGNSHVMDGINPAIITQKTGLKAYNLALYALSSMNALELLLKYQNYPRLIFIDFSSRYSIYQHDDYVDTWTEQVSKRSYRKRLLYKMIDYIHWLMPSLFIPRGYRALLKRSVQKLRKFLRTGRIESSRYSPFRYYISYDWYLDKETNHRAARRVRPQTKREEEYETYLLHKTISESHEKCDIESPAYKEGMKQTVSMIQTLLQQQVQIVFMRMPLHEKVIQHENQHFRGFFQEVEHIAAHYNLEYIDFNLPEHRGKIGDLDFYSDLQHMTDASSDMFSQYLVQIIEDSYISS